MAEADHLPLRADVPVAAFGWHAVFEALAYTVGFQVFLALRRRQGHPTAGHEGGIWVLVGALLGAVVGAKLLDLAQFWSTVGGHLGDPRVWGSGKTVVGGLLGGWVGVELAKARVGIRGSTGDLLVLPLGLGVAIGRLGCLAAGAEDHTFGVPVAWGWTGSDGIARHPAPLYELLLVLPLAGWLHRRTFPDGHRFRWFMVGYLSIRVAIDFLKPPFGADPIGPMPIRLGWMTPIQWTALAGAVVAASLNLRARRPTR